MKSVILCGTKIGDNCIIGAGSIVKGLVEANSVYAGNPASKICTLEEFYIKKKQRCEIDAANICRIYKEKTGLNARDEQLREYQYLYKNALEDKALNTLITDTGYRDVCLEYLNSHSANYRDLDDFLRNI